MESRSRILIFVSLLLVLLSFQVFSAIGAAQPVVRGVLFWAEGCPACHAVLTDLLPRLGAQYGDQLDIQLIQVSETLNYDYFRQIEDLHEVPAGRRGVPALFIGDQLLVGENEIPAKLPALVEKYLATGGVDYPDLPDLAAHLGAAVADDGACAPDAECDDAASAGVDLLGGVQLASLAGSQSSGESTNGFDGQGLGVAVMVLLLIALTYALAGTVVTGLGRRIPVFSEWADYLIPILAVVGIGVASYLTFVEANSVSAVCGPVGDCNAVQSSPYAKLFGVLPVGLLGLAGYIGIIGAWFVARFGRDPFGRWAALATLGMALFGALFTIYLTYLELFVILAVCAWCLGSAVIMSLVLILAMGPAVDALLAE